MERNAVVIQSSSFLLTDDDVSAFWRDGYLVVKRLLPPPEAEELRRRALDQLEDDHRAELVVVQALRQGEVHYPWGDLLTKPRLREVLLDPRVLGVTRALLGAAPVYFGDSSYQIGSPECHNNGMEWHRDNRVSDRLDLAGDDWKGRYTLIRLAFYLQDHLFHSGGVAVQRGSHVAPSGSPVMVESETGDLVIWSLRTLHAGHSVRLRVLPRLVLEYRTMRFIPHLLRRKEERRRVAVFMTFGARDEHLSRYVEYLKTRDYFRDACARSRFGEDVWTQARAAGLDVIRVLPNYGTPA